ncbi:MAG: sialidase family protein [Phycisphaerales bacterium]
MIRPCGVVLSALMAAFPALAAGAEPPGDDEGEEYEERLGDPYLAPGPLRTSVPAVFADRDGFPQSAQVNVTATQLNILGDAANEPSIAVDPFAPNRMTIGWRQFDNVASNFRQAGFAWTVDGGRTWHKGTIEAGTFRSDPIVRAGPDGTVFYNSLTEDFSCWVFRSQDAGRSWGGPAASFGGDKQWMAVDRTGGPGRGFLYQMDSFGAFTRSTDGGMSWMSPSGYPTARGNLVVGPGGVVYGGGASTSLTVVRSLNANQAGQTPTFQAATLPITLSGVGGAVVNPGGLAGQVVVGVDPSAGRLGWVYVVATAPGTATDIVFSRSTDGGVSWSSLVRLPGRGATALAGYQWFGTMSVAPNGRIDVVYNDTASRAYTQSQLVYTASYDGGVTWLAPVPMGPVWDSTVGWPNQNKIGDYYDMESDLLGADLVYAATYNGEQDVYYLRIGPRDCNGNGVDDAVETASGDVLDTNGNGVPDSCEIAAGAVPDVNHNGIPDNACPDTDFNNDGLFPDTADIDDFLSVFSGGPCGTPSCDSIDYNHDRLFPDTADIDALLSVFSGGPC